MIKADKELLNHLFSSNLQYVVPFFQRAYVWDKANWEALWEHVNRITEKSSTNGKNEHFIGTLIIKQQHLSNIREQKYDLIDGQQRLTTFALLIKAIANKASGQSPYHKLKEKTNELVVFEDSQGNKFFRIEHSRIDKNYFEAVLGDYDLSKLQNQKHKILECYRYFQEKLKNYTDEQLDNLKNLILNSVPAISMVLSAEDDEQEIFDTINSLGVRLTTGELLKNFIFSDNAIKPHYDKSWYSVFEEDETKISFWNKLKTSGRVMRTNIEVLLYCYLIIQRKSAVELEKLFGEYKHWLQDKTQEDKLKFLKELGEYAEIYRDFPTSEELNQIRFSEVEKRFFHVIENLGITTVYPLILHIYKQIAEKSVRLELLGIIESYLVRRNVCRLTTKNYNNFFVQIINRFTDDPITADKLLSLLKYFKDDSNRFPSDEEFKIAFENEPISNTNAKEILFCISLYQISSKNSDINTLSSSSYSVEHLMPLKWEANWSKKRMSDIAKTKRNRKIKTLGNLTLVTKSLNSSMKNESWDKKKKMLKNFSVLKITTDYLDYSDWNEEVITNRATTLASLAVEIWK